MRRAHGVQCLCNNVEHHISAGTQTEPLPDNGKPEETPGRELGSSRTVEFNHWVANMRPSADTRLQSGLEQKKVIGLWA